VPELGVKDDLKRSHKHSFGAQKRQTGSFKVLNSKRSMAKEAPGRKGNNIPIYPMY
jgi:hypothetical protein